VVARGDERADRTSHQGKKVGRYVLHGPISAGGMASVHFGRLVGPVGFTRVVAIKRLHAAFAADPESVAMFLDEARLAARIHHPNVVGTLDVAEDNGELFLVMDYVGGLSLSALLREAGRAGERMPPEHAAGIAVGTLHGLHAAHEARSAAGESLGIVHRDVSPPNILVGIDGVARVIDFGIAKAVERVHATRETDLRGKILYMSPEQLNRERVDRRTDVYAASVVLWEMLASRRYIDVGDGNAIVKIHAALERRPSPPSEVAPNVPRALDDVVMRGLARDPAARFATALEMAAALEAALTPSGQREIGEWVSRISGDTLRKRAEVLQRIETAATTMTDELPPAPRAERELTALLMPPPELPTVTVFAATSTSVLRTAPLPSPATTSLATGNTDRSAPVPRGVGVRPIVGVIALAAVVLAWAIGTYQGRTVAPAGEPVVTAEPAAFPAPAPLPPLASAAETAPPDGAAEPASSAEPPSGLPASASAPRRRPRPSCNPPYTMDHGIRVPKRGCL
jgi:eukaryotic-like serine/threonine-protein kinase